MATLESPERLMADAIFGNDSEHPLPLKYHEHETEPNSVAQSYRVTFSLAPQHEKTILPGMTVTVRVSEASNRPDAMIDIPQSALDSDAEGKFRVWVYQPKKSVVTAQTVKVHGFTKQGHALVAGL